MLHRILDCEVDGVTISYTDLHMLALNKVNASSHHAHESTIKLSKYMFNSLVLQMICESEIDGDSLDALIMRIKDLCNDTIAYCRWPKYGLGMIRSAKWWLQYLTR